MKGALQDLKDLLPTSGVQITSVHRQESSGVQSDWSCLFWQQEGAQHDIRQVIVYTVYCRYTVHNFIGIKYAQKNPFGNPVSFELIFGHLTTVLTVRSPLYIPPPPLLF